MTLKEYRPLNCQTSGIEKQRWGVTEYQGNGDRSEGVMRKAGLE